MSEIDIDSAKEERAKRPYSDSGRHIRSFVIRSGRMTEAQGEAIRRLGPRFMIPFDQERMLDLHGAFGDSKPVIMEIGFGMGAATWQIARNMDAANFLGVEVHAPGVGKLLMEIEAHAIGNLRIIQHDAVEVLESMIPESSLAGLHIFYPDPWPKKRHHKRRLMRPELVRLMASRLAEGGYLYFVTDIEEYARSTLELLTSAPELENAYAGYAEPQAWRPETKFESRASKANRGCWELYFLRRLSRRTQ